IVGPSCIMQPLDCLTAQLLSSLRCTRSSWSRATAWVSPIQILQGFLDFGGVAAPESPDGFFVRQSSADRSAQLRFVTENLSNVFGAKDASSVAVSDHAQHFF